MTSENTISEAQTNEDTQTDEESKPGLIGKLKKKVQNSLSAMNQHCDAVEQAKAVGDRENIKKYGKDWINRCCG
jgi:hypothetical protein